MRIIIFVICLNILNISCKGQEKEKCAVDNAIKTINMLPEVQLQRKYVDSLSNNKKHLSFITDSLALKHKKYYRVKTGLNGEFHWETYTIFYVNRNNCSEVLDDEVISGDILTLEQWRKFKKNQSKMNIDSNLTESVKFSNLFNESSNIKFTPKDLNQNSSEIQQFKLNC